MTMRESDKGEQEHGRSPGAETGAAAGEPDTEQALRARQALDAIERQLARGELRTARRALLAARALLGGERAPRWRGGDVLGDERAPRREDLSPGEDDRARADALGERLARLERLEGPTEGYEAAVARGDTLAAREWAARAVAVCGGEQGPGGVSSVSEEEAELWRVRHAELAARVRAEWRIAAHELDVDGTGPALASCAGELATIESVPPPRLADDRLVFVSVFERWVFVREVELERRRLRWIGWLRTPGRLDDASIQVHGNAIHLVARSGDVLELSRRPFDVVRWLSLRPFMLPDRLVEDAFVVPSGRYLWADLKEPHEECGIAVVDTREWRVCRRVHQSGFIEPVCGADPPRVLVDALDEQPALYDESGASIEWSEAPTEPVKAVVAHPGGQGLLALVAALDALGPDETDDMAPLGVVAPRPGQERPSPLLIADTYHEGPSTLAVAHDARRAWLLAPVDGRPRLIAFRPGWDGLVEDWRREVSDRTVLWRDSESRRVVALAPTASGLDFRLLESGPPELEPAPFGHLDLLDAAPRHFFCTRSEPEDAEHGRDFELEVEVDRQRRAGELDRWTEARRKERRADPRALAELAGALLRMSWEPELPARLLAFALERHPADPLLQLRQADLDAQSGRWAEVDRRLADVEPGALPGRQACHLHHLRGLARLHAGDLEGARRCWRAGAAIDPKACSAGWNLELADALLAPLTEAAGGSALRQIVRACRLADEALARGDAAAARDVLERPVVHARLEVQSAARLAEAHLGLEPAAPLERLHKALALARFASVDLERPPALDEIPGLGWGAERLTDVARRARDWLEAFDRREPPAPVPPAAEEPEEPEEPREAREPREPREQPAEKPAAKRLLDAHALPPLGHEVMCRLVPGLEAAMRETVRYARAQPGWDETQTLGEDLVEFGPVRLFLEQFRARLSAEGAAEPEVLGRSALLGQHIDYYANFELQRRKLFYVDESLAWQLARTNLDIEGRLLRLPFPCFGVVFTDPSTLGLGQALLESAPGGASRGPRPRIVTVYLKHLAAALGARRLSVSVVIDRPSPAWPELCRRELSFAEDDHLEAILTSPREERVAPLPEMRQLLHLVVNAVLYANSANLAWPLTQSPIRRLKARAGGGGAGRKRRAARQARELAKTYSNEDVFHLPGRIPISQLRALQRVGSTGEGQELMTRFLVRGHWRRAARGWRDQTVRWIEPYWKGPELAAIIEREYKLEV
jgi:hypothetical protein